MLLECLLPNRGCANCTSSVFRLVIYCFINTIYAISSRVTIVFVCETFTLSKIFIYKASKSLKDTYLMHLGPQHAFLDNQPYEAHVWSSSGWFYLLNDTSSGMPLLFYLSLLYRPYSSFVGLLCLFSTIKWCYNVLVVGWSDHEYVFLVIRPHQYKFLWMVITLLSWLPTCLR